MKTTRIALLPLIWIANLTVGWLVFRAERAYRTIPALPPGNPHRAQPIDVVVAGSSTPDLARTLATQSLQPKHIVYLGDGDRLAEDGPARVVVLDPRIRLAPGALAAADVIAERYGDPAFSISARRRLLGFAERTIVPAASLLYCMGFRPAHLAAGGPFLVVSRDVALAAQAEGDPPEAFLAGLMRQPAVRLARGDRWAEFIVPTGRGSVREIAARGRALGRRDRDGAIRSTLAALVVAAGPIAAIVGLRRKDPDLIVAGLAGMFTLGTGAIPFVHRAGLPARWATGAPLTVPILPFLIAFTPRGRR
jgi:hypothetical protein